MHARVASLLLIASTVPALAAEGVWKWVDPQGVTHYSDRPVPGAVQVDIKLQNRPSGDAVPTPASAPVSTPPAQPVGPVYTQLEVWQPAAEESIVNTGGVVPVRIRIEPLLRPRHTLALYLDGRRVDSLAAGALETELQEVPRGTHSLVPVIYDDAGKVVQQGAQVVFYVRQESAQQPPVGPLLRPQPRS